MIRPMRSRCLLLGSAPSLMGLEWLFLPVTALMLAFSTTTPLDALSGVKRTVRGTCSMCGSEPYAATRNTPCHCLCEAPR